MVKFLFLLSFIFTMVFAQQNAEEFHFVGLTVSKDAIEFESIADIQNNDETSFGFRYGRQTLEWRTVFTFSGNSDIKTFGLEIDKILVDELFGLPEIRPYLGASVGYVNYQKNDGFYYGGNFGFLIYATDTIDLDLGYHYYKTGSLETLDTMKGPNLSVHYFY